MSKSMVDSEGALAAYWRFFETFNTRDAYSYSTAMSYPHVRVSWRTEPTVLADIETHALSVGWESVIAGGWDHTVGKEPTLLGIRDNKAHIAGGWTRYTKDDEPLFGNRICYIVTQVDEKWGIQCRFGTDSGLDPEPEDSELERKLTELVRVFLEASHTGNLTEAWQWVHPELMVIDPGRVASVKNAEGWEVPHVDVNEVNDISIVHRGSGSATVNARLGQRQVLLYLTKNETEWKIKAGSWL